MPARPGLTLRRRKLVKCLVEARRAADMSVRALAAEIDLQPGTVSKIENGLQGLTVRNIKAIGRATGLSRARIDELLLLAANDGNDRDWLVEFQDDIPEWFALYPVLERDADEIWTYSAELVDGLLQTRDYAEAVLRVGVPSPSAEDVVRSVDLRIARQSFRRPEPPRLRFVLNEAVLRRSVGGPEVMREQVNHLIRFSRRRHVILRVLPFSAGAHPGMKSGFTLLRFPEGFDDMDCVYLENENGAVWQEITEHIAHYSVVFDRLLSMSLSPKDTRALLASLV